jgi:hypothetical protein
MQALCNRGRTQPAVACHGVGCVVRALRRPSVRTRGLIRALCQSLVESGRGGCSVTMAAALRKSERRSPPEGGRRSQSSKLVGFWNRKIDSMSSVGGCAALKWTHARPCRRGFFPYQRITDASSFLERRSLPGSLCLHSLLQQRGVCQGLFLCIFVLALLAATRARFTRRRSRDHHTRSCAAAKNPPRIRGMC